MIRVLPIFLETMLKIYVWQPMMVLFRVQCCTASKCIARAIMISSVMTTVAVLCSA